MCRDWNGCEAASRGQFANLGLSGKWQLKWYAYNYEVCFKYMNHIYY